MNFNGRGQIIADGKAQEIYDAFVIEGQPPSFIAERFGYQARAVRRFLTNQGLILNYTSPYARFEKSDYKGRLIWARLQQRKIPKEDKLILFEELKSFPDKCPLLEIPLDYSGSDRNDATVELDKINPEKGYIPGNVWLISSRANRLKNNASLEELELLTHNLRAKVATL